MDFNRMSNSEIRQQLILMGQNVGPVTDTTRAVHLKKLRNLLSEGDGPIPEPVPLPTLSNGNGVHLLDIVDGGNTSNGNGMHLLDIVGENTTEAQRSATERYANNVLSENHVAPKVPSIRSVTPTAVDDGSDEEMRGEESMRYLSAEEMEWEMNHGRSSAVYESSSSNSNKVLIVALLVTLTVFVFFLSDRLHRQTNNSTVEDDL